MQETPNGDYVIITLEGENPAEGFGKIMATTGGEFSEFALDVYRFDMKCPPPPLPRFVYDSRELNFWYASQITAAERTTKTVKTNKLIGRLVRGESGIFLGFIFRPAVLPHVMLVDLVAAKVKQLRPAFNNTLAGLGVGVAAFPGSGDAVAVVAAVGFVDFQITGVLEPTVRPVPQASTHV